MNVPRYWRNQDQAYNLTGKRDANGNASIVKRQIIVSQDEQPIIENEVIVTISNAA